MKRNEYFFSLVSTNDVDRTQSWGGGVYNFLSSSRTTPFNGQSKLSEFSSQALRLPFIRKMDASVGSGRDAGGGPPVGISEIANLAEKDIIQ